jgi:hypothetical protein
LAFPENNERLAIEKIKLLLHNIAGLLHFLFDRFRRRLVAPQAFEPGAAVEVDDGNAPVRPKAFLQPGKVIHTVGEMVIGVDR